MVSILNIDICYSITPCSAIIHLSNFCLPSSFWFHTSRFTVLLYMLAFISKLKNLLFQIKSLIHPGTQFAFVTCQRISLPLNFIVTPKQLSKLSAPQSRCLLSNFHPTAITACLLYTSRCV